MHEFFRRIFCSKIKELSPDTLANNGSTPKQTNTGPPAPGPTPTPSSRFATNSPRTPVSNPMTQTLSAPIQTPHNNLAASRQGNNLVSSSQAHPESTVANESIPQHSIQQRQTTLRSLDFRKEARRSRNKKTEVVQRYSDYCLEWDALRDWLSTRFVGYQFDEEATKVPVS